MSVSRKTVSPAPTERRPGLQVSRLWQIVVICLLALPWLLVGALLLRSDQPAVPPANPEPPSSGQEAAAGPWGRLTSTSVVISPPLELIADNWGRDATAGKYWFFPSTEVPAAAAFLSSAGVPPEQVATLIATAQPEPRIKGIVLTPAPAILATLRPEVREKLYIQLAGSALNVNIAHAFRYPGASTEDWLGRSLMAPATRQLIDPLVYRHGQHLYFADVDLIWSRITDVEERRRVAKTLLRQTALRVRLSVPEVSDVPGLVTYWGRGGRRTDIRPLLESIVGKDPQQSIDIVHLLPSFAREHLYRYPKLTARDYGQPVLANCLWTALNFFNAEPDDRYLGMDYAIDRLKRDYYLVENSPEFGDIIALVDEQGTIFHAVNFLADNLVFTKNGVSPMAPWVILPLDVVLDYYKPRSEKPRLLYHRRNDF